MNEDLRRVFEFVSRGDMFGDRTEPSRFGLAVFLDALPLRLDSNHLLIVELPRTVSAEQVAEEAARFDRRAVMVRDDRTGERLAPGFERLGWKIERGLVMAHRRPPEREADTASVDEVDQAALRSARRRQTSGYSWATPEVIEHLLDAKLVIGRAVRTRFFAIRHDGQVVSYTDLYSDGRTAQIEDVATLEEHRGRGYASAVVMRAIVEARLEGCDMVFLVADAEDWPKELYRRLGFDEIGGYVKFVNAP